MSRRERDKGARGEREACEALRPVFPDVARRGANHAGVEDGTDLLNTGAFAVQVKRHKRCVNPSVLDTIDAPGIPLLLTKADRGEWRAVLPLADLVRILEDVGVAYE